MSRLKMWRAVKLKYGKDFVTVQREKSQGGKISVRRHMFEMAQRKDRNAVPILIYLDKKYLGGLPKDPGEDDDGRRGGTNVQVNIQNTQQQAVLTSTKALGSVETADLVKMLIERGECAVQIPKAGGMDVREQAADSEEVSDRRAGFAGTQGPDGDD